MHVYLKTPLPSEFHKFTGKERDSETGNDDFGARYYSNRFGRWLSADWSAVPAPVPYANLTNPQTLNLYAMVADAPESFADLDGHAEESTWKLILDTVYVKGSVGLGLGVQAKALGLKVEAQASMQAEGKLSLSGHGEVNGVSQGEVAASGKVPGVGEVTIGARKTGTVPLSREGEIVPASEQKSEIESSVGVKVKGNEGSASNSELGVAGASVCVGVCAGVEIGIDTKNLRDPGSPPAPKPPAPPATLAPAAVFCGRPGQECSKPQNAPPAKKD